MNLKLTLAALLLLMAGACSEQRPAQNDTAAETAADTPKHPPFVWENASVYFLLTDRFNNGDPSNDQAFDRKADGAVLRSFMGGDIKGITQKVKEGYFNDLGISAIWFTPVVEQVHGFTDEGTGKTYAFHGYWAKDWTALDPNFGTGADLKELVQTAHDNGIRIILDVVINHTGPVTASDPAWPEEWVRLSPTCTFQNTETTVECTLVDNLPDIKTEKDEAVELPPFLVEKWKQEGRYKQEMAELDAFFAETGYPRAPRYYLIKWLTDWIKEYGVDGFRVDTVKHTEASVWEELRKEAAKAFAQWKAENPDAVLDDNEFFMTGEVYNYDITNGQQFDMGQGETVNFFENGFKNLINFGFKRDAALAPDSVFSLYSHKMNEGEMKGLSVLNYLTSHDDGQPFDKERTKVMETGSMLLLAPGGAQIYYGDETARTLTVEGAEGDAHLRSFMNWDELEANAERNGFKVAEVLAHWQKLGQFRREHVSVGAGVHQKVQDSPYAFTRTYAANGLQDKVLVAMDVPSSQLLTLATAGIFEDGTTLKEYYSGQTVTVEGGQVTIENPSNLVLLGVPFGAATM